MSLKGKLEDLGLGEIFQIVSLSRKSGILFLQKGKDESRVIFCDGKIVHAAINPPAQGGVQALGEEDVRKIVLDLFTWIEGHFSFELREGSDSPASELPQGVLHPGISIQDLHRPRREGEGATHAGATPTPRPFFDLTEILEETADGGGDGSPLFHQTPGLHLLKSMLQELQTPAPGGGIILLVLRFASEFMNRAVVFRIGGEEIVGLGQFGIETLQADAQVRGFRIPVGVPSPFGAVLEQRIPIKIRLDEAIWHSYFREALGESVPEESFFGPILSEGKPVAILYGDNLPEARGVGDTEPLEIFLSQAGMAMEKALLERRLQKKNAN